MAEPADRLARRVPAFLADAQTGDGRARGRLTAAARHQVRVHRDRLERKASTVARSAPSRIESREASLRAQAARLGPMSFGHLGREDERLHSWRRLLAAYDVERQLERGYSLDADRRGGGALVRSAAGLVEQQQITTRFADGTVRSRVERADVTQEPVQTPEQATERED